MPKPGDLVVFSNPLRGIGVKVRAKKFVGEKFTSEGVDPNSLFLFISVLSTEHAIQAAYADEQYDDAGSPYDHKPWGLVLGQNGLYAMRVSSLAPVEELEQQETLRLDVCIEALKHEGCFRVYHQETQLSSSFDF